MLSIQEIVEKAFLQTLNTISHVNTPHFICAYSGGPDSSVLLYLLKKFQKKYSYGLTAAYVNHNIRSEEEMAEEREQVVQFIRKLKIDFQIKTYSPGFINWYAEKKGLGIEAAARNCRYSFFNSLSPRYQNPLLVLGHNNNDQTETLLMRLFQGAGPEGLKGIKQVRGEILRPLLSVCRKDILAYAEEKNIPFWNDSTNDEGDYRRNRIRQDLIPVLDSIFPDFRKAFNNHIEDYTALGDFAFSSLSWEKKSGYWTIPRKEFSLLPISARKKLVLDIINHVNIGTLPRDFRIPGRFFKPLEKLGSQDMTLLKGYGISLKSKGAYLCLFPLAMEKNKGVFHFLDRSHPYHSTSLTIRISDFSQDKIGYKYRPEKYLIVREIIQGGGGLYDGTYCLLKWNSYGKILFKAEGFKKKLENSATEGLDCIIIE